MDNGYITFGSFNRVTKFTDPMLIAWREILNRVPDSKLLLKTIDSMFVYKHFNKVLTIKK